MAATNESNNQRREDQLKAIRQRELEPDEPLNATEAERLERIRIARRLESELAAAGAAYLAHMGTGGGIAAIPHTGPAQYVVAGTMAAIGKALGEQIGALVPRVGGITNKVGCERNDGLLNIHGENETCEVCAASLASQSQAAQPTDDLPQLPNMKWIIRAQDDGTNRGFYGFDHDQMRDYGRAAIAAHIAGASQATQPSGDAQELVQRMRARADLESLDKMTRCLFLDAAMMVEYLAGTSQATKAQAEPTPEMLRAAVKFMNGIDIYEKVPRGVTEIEEGIYAEVFKAMMLAAPVAKEAPAVLEDIAVSQMDRAQLQVEVFRLRSKTAPAMGGYVSVPVEPTEAMVHAAEDLPAPRMFAKVYRAMIAAAPVASVAKEATRDAETTEKAKPIAAAVRAAERVDAMHKGVVGVFAAIKAEHLAQANVLPPTRGTESQHNADPYDVIEFALDLAENKGNQGAMDFLAAWWWETNDDFLRVHWPDFTKLELASRCRAQGGITNTESGSDLATTTSTVSAPTDENIELVKSGLREILAASRTPDRAQIHALAFESLSVLDSTKGAQKAPEEARNQAVSEGLEMAARHLDKQRQAVDQDHAYQEPDTGAWVFDRPETEEYSNTLAELADEIRALRTSSTDQANADTGSAA